MSTYKLISFNEFSRWCRCQTLNGGHVESPCGSYNGCSIVHKKCNSSNCRVWQKLKCVQEGDMMVKCQHSSECKDKNCDHYAKHKAFMDKGEIELCTELTSFECDSVHKKCKCVVFHKNSKK